MTQTPDMPTVPTKTPEQAQKAERAVRLASALRANLKRRKAATAPSSKPRN